MTAYDYERQEWVEGPKATELLRAQLRRELEVLAGPNGPALAAAGGVTVAQAIEAAQSELRWLEEKGGES